MGSCQTIIEFSNAFTSLSKRLDDLLNFRRILAVLSRLDICDSIVAERLDLEASVTSGDNSKIPHPTILT